MDTSGKVEALFGAVALASTVAMFIVSYSWAYPSHYPETFTLNLEGSPEPIRTLAILVLIVAALGIIHGLKTSFSEMALGLLIMVWMALIMGWFFIESSHVYLERINVTFTPTSLLLYSSIGIALEITMIAHGIYRGVKSEEYVPGQTS